MKKAFITLVAMGWLVGCDNSNQTSQKDQTSNQVTVTGSPWQWPYMTKEEVQPTSFELDMDPVKTAYAVVLDMSGSMGEGKCAGSFETKAEAAKVALDKWSLNLKADDKLGLIVFVGDSIKDWVPIKTNNVAAFRKALSKASPGGGTPLASAVKQGYQMLTHAGMEQQGYGNYRMVVVTDGEANSGEDPGKIVTWLAQNTPIEIHTIGFCIGEGHSLNQPGITAYQTADNPEALIAGLKNVLAESQSFDTTQFK